MDRGPIILCRASPRHSATYNSRDVNRLPLTTRRAFIRGMSAGAIVAAIGRYQHGYAAVGAIGRSSAGVGSGFNGYYPSGHWTNSPLGSLSNLSQTASQIYPRPDAETGAYARHRWMFYDGTHTFKNIIPIIGRLGAFPYVYELITAPAAAGAVMGGTAWQPSWSISRALAAGYGDLWCTCTGTFSAGTFTVRMHDQAGNYNDFTFTSSTIAGYDATNGEGFIFLDPVSGVDSAYPVSGISNNITTPILTSAHAFGATQGTSTYPNAILVVRGTGTLAISNQSATFGISAVLGKNPMAVIGYPGESVTIDLTGAGTKEAFDLQNNTPDQFFQGITFQNGPSTSAQFSCFYAQSGQTQNRLTLHNLSFPNIFTGSNVVGSGASELTLDDPNSGALTPLHTYIAMKGVSETNRTRNAGVDTNNTIMLTAYKSQYGCLELCSCTGTVTANYGFRLKLGNSDWTIRQSLCVTTQSLAMGTSDFVGGTSPENTIPNANAEYCFNTISANASATQPSLYFNVAADGTATNHYAYRNSILGWAGAYPASSTGPFAFSNNAIQYGSASQAVMYNNGTSYVGGTLPATVTNDGGSTGNSRAQASTGVLDASTYLLTGTYRTTYLGTDGAEIA